MAATYCNFLAARTSLSRFGCSQYVTIVVIFHSLSSGSAGIVPSCAPFRYFCNHFFLFPSHWPYMTFVVIPLFLGNLMLRSLQCFINRLLFLLIVTLLTFRASYITILVLLFHWYNMSQIKGIKEKTERGEEGGKQYEKEIGNPTDYIFLGLFLCAFHMFCTLTSSFSQHFSSV